MKINRKELKKKGKSNLKKHYAIFVVLCIICAIIGSEFSSSLSYYKVDKNDSVESRLMSENAVAELDKIKTEQLDKIKQLKNEDKDKILGHSRGVLSSIVNSVNSGSVYITVFSAIHSIVKAKSHTIIIFIIFCLILWLLYWFFIINTSTIVLRRYFLEGRVYNKLTKETLLYYTRFKNLFNIAKTELLTFLYFSLWCLTIVGGAIKYFSYYLVDFILAENPKIKPSVAITLSRNMMKGHKWECFVLSLSFLPWDILNLFTFNLLNIFYLNVYKTATFTEFYVKLREEAKENQIENIELLDDVYLYTKAPRKVLDNKYLPMIKQIGKKQKYQEKKGIKNFISKNFGISFNDENEKIYEKNASIDIQTESIKNELYGETYPVGLTKKTNKVYVKNVDIVNHVRRYTILNLILFFFIFAFIGWLWEVTLHLVQHGEFVNRGALYGPWLPIYGSGGVLILMLLYRFRSKPWLHVVLTVLLCGVIEYFASIYLESIHNGTKWWDYSGYFINLHGRVCAEGLFVFALAGFFAAYYIAPSLDGMLKKFNTKYLTIIAVILIAFFISDQLYSKDHPNKGKGITDYSSKIEIENLS